VLEAIIVEAGSAPHCPAGHFSPYSNGEKEAGRSYGTLLATLIIAETADERPSPRHYTGRGRRQAGEGQR
jgi:hypothetical protein